MFGGRRSIEATRACVCAWRKKPTAGDLVFDDRHATQHRQRSARQPRRQVSHHLSAVSRLNSTTRAPPDPRGLCRRPARTNGVSRRSGSFGSVRVRAGPVGSVQWNLARPISTHDTGKRKVVNKLPSNESRNLTDHVTVISNRNPNA